MSTPSPQLLIYIRVSSLYPGCNRNSSAALLLWAGGERRCSRRRRRRRCFLWVFIAAAVFRPKVPAGSLGTKPSVCPYKDSVSPLAAFVPAARPGLTPHSTGHPPNPPLPPHSPSLHPLVDLNAVKNDSSSSPIAFDNNSAEAPLAAGESTAPVGSCG